MKKLTALFFPLMFSITSYSQINCSQICILNIGNLDTVNNTLDVTIYNGNTDHINYPSVMLVDMNGDTVANIDNIFYFFTHPAQDTLVHTIPTTLANIPNGFTCTVYLRDNLTDSVCSYSYPMNCTLAINESTICFSASFSSG